LGTLTLKHVYLLLAVFFLQFHLEDERWVCKVGEALNANNDE